MKTRVRESADYVSKTEVKSSKFSVDFLIKCFITITRGDNK